MTDLAWDPDPDSGLFSSLGHLFTSFFKLQVLGAETHSATELHRGN